MWNNLDSGFSESGFTLYKRMLVGVVCGRMGEFVCYSVFCADIAILTGF